MNWTMSRRRGVIAGTLMTVALPAMATHQEGDGNAPGGGYGWTVPAPVYGPGAYGPMPRPYGYRHWMPRAPYAPPMPPMRGYGQAYPGQTAYPAAPQQRRAAAAEPAQAPANASAAGDAATIDIRQMRFDPPRVTVEKGATVTWTQSDGMPHTVTANDGAFGSDRLVNGGSFSRTFDEAGTYRYYCSIHPSMQGEVVVVE